MCAPSSLARMRPTRCGCRNTFTRPFGHVVLINSVKDLFVSSSVPLASSTQNYFYKVFRGSPIEDTGDSSKYHRPALVWKYANHWHRRKVLWITLSLASVKEEMYNCKQPWMNHLVLNAILAASTFEQFNVHFTTQAGMS